MEKLAYGLYKKMLSLNLIELRTSCLQIESRLKSNFLDKMESQRKIKENSPASTRGAFLYNAFTFPYPEIYNLYIAVRSTFLEAEKDHYGINRNLDYFSQAWLNIYSKNEFADWHDHGPNIPDSWHGFICVDTHHSKSSYDINGDHLDIESIDNQIVIGINGYKHRSYPWHEDDRKRITIAFDICCGNKLVNWRGNHWVPI